jgi:hypothetical protein
MTSTATATSPRTSSTKCSPRHLSKTRSGTHPHAHADGCSLKDDQIRKLVDQTFEEADNNGDGLINFAEYKAMVAKHPAMIKNMTIANLGTAQPSPP